MAVMKQTRLEVLAASLARKEAEFARRIGEHMEDVKSANGQPLNDKRNGAATTGRWDRQDDAMRTLKAGIEKTKAAIERETEKAGRVDATEIPDGIREMVRAGELTQWRKHPNTFFVPGVDKGRIVWVEKERKLGVRYAEAVPAEQYQKFRETFYKAKASLGVTCRAPA